MNKRDEDLYARYLAGQSILTNISRSPVLWVPCSDPLYPWVLVGGTVRYTSYEVYAELSPARNSETPGDELGWVPLSDALAETIIRGALKCDSCGELPGMPRLCHICEDAQMPINMRVGNDIYKLERYANGELR